MLKIGKNWGKIANYPPNAQQRSAPLVATVRVATQPCKLIAFFIFLLLQNIFQKNGQSGS